VLGGDVPTEVLHAPSPSRNAGMSYAAFGPLHVRPAWPQRASPSRAWPPRVSAPTRVRQPSAGPAAATSCHRGPTEDASHSVLELLTMRGVQLGGLLGAVDSHRHRVYVLFAAAHVAHHELARRPGHETPSEEDRRVAVTRSRGSRVRAHRAAPPAAPGRVCCIRVVWGIQLTGLCAGSARQAVVRVSQGLGVVPGGGPGLPGVVRSGGPGLPGGGPGARRVSPVS